MNVYKNDNKTNLTKKQRKKERNAKCLFKKERKKAIFQNDS